MKIEKMTTHEIATYLREKRNTSFILWQVEDVIDRAEEFGVICTEEEAIEILGNIDNKQDCEYGITWDTIDYFVNDYFEN